MQRTSAPTSRALPLRPLRLLVEDPHVAMGDLPAPSAGLEITACAGPTDEAEVCPLVMDGSCPLGAFDVVVTALDGPWASCVHAAWAQTRTPVVDARGVTVSDPEERLTHHIGAALQRLWRARGMSE